MKKLLYLVLFSLILVSCSNDESDVEPDPYILENIIGSWAYDTVTVITGIPYDPYSEFD